MLRNQLNDNGHCDYLVDAGCMVNGTRGCVSMRSASSRVFGKRIQRIDLPAGVLEQHTEPAGGTSTEPAQLPSMQTTHSTWRQRQVELPSPIWASLVLGKA